MRRQRAEYAVEHGLDGLGVDIADHRDFQMIARQILVRKSLQIVDADASHRFQRAADRPAIGMAGIRGLPPAQAGKIAWALELPAQPRESLRAVELDILGVEARRRERQPQVIERLVLVLDKRAQRAVDLLATGAEAQVHGFAVEPI